MQELPIKELPLEVSKAWGKEFWIVNCPEYCGKLLFIDRDAESSYHYHKEKKETFYCIEGFASLTVEGKPYHLHLMTWPKTILPGQKHGFHARRKTVLLEISTHHDENDVFRLTESKAGIKSKERLTRVNPFKDEV